MPCLGVNFDRELDSILQTIKITIESHLCVVFFPFSLFLRALHARKHMVVAALVASKGDKKSTKYCAINYCSKLQVQIEFKKKTREFHTKAGNHLTWQTFCALGLHLGAKSNVCVSVRNTFPRCDAMQNTHVCSTYLVTLIYMRCL